MSENEGQGAPTPPTQTEKEQAYWSAVDAATARTEAERDVDKYLIAALQSPMLVAVFDAEIKREKEFDRQEPEVTPESVAYRARLIADAALAERDRMLMHRGVK